MARDSQYEVYQIRDSAWTLVERLQTLDDQSAREQAQARFAASQLPTVVLEESRDSDGKPSARIIWRSPGSFTSAVPPPFEVDMAPRLFMVALCGVGVGAIGAVLTGVVMAGARGSVGGLALVVGFVAFALGGALLAFRWAVPMELLLWRNKSAVTRRRAIAALEFGSADEAESAPAAPQAPASGEGDTYRRPADDAKTPGAGQGGDNVSQGSESVAALLRDFVAAESAKLQTFAEQTITAILGRFPDLQAFQRFGFNLLVAGAAEELRMRDALTVQTAREVILDVLTRTGTPRDAAIAFCDRLPTASERPRSCQMLEWGRAQVKAHLDQTVLAEDAGPVASMTYWSSPQGGSAMAETLTLLLTDLVGSTAMTTELGNAGAQRVVRAHNTIVRNAVRSAKGTEVKHTGDGILAWFRDPVSAAQAAVEVQQEAAAFVRDNPALPLTLRIGLHAGEVIVDGDELFGNPVSVIDEICAAGGAGEISASASVQSRSAGGIYKYPAIEARAVATDTGEQPLFRLAWEPKRAYGVPPIEYRQIGTKPAKSDPG
jgi:adenylate cyclase